jgi:4-hydroxybenzoate polyprenyltransferase
MLIAGLTAMVPMLVGLYFFQSQELMETGVEKHFIYPFTHFTDKAFVVFLSIALAGFAFILNFAREIVKDMEDIDGDKLLKAKTAPIVMGRLNSKVLTFVILMVSILTVGFINWAVPTLDLKALAPILLSGFLVFVALFFLLNAKTKHDYRPVNAFIKLAMVSGLLSPVYWKLIIIYG